MPLRERIVVLVEPELGKALRQRARREKITLADLVRRALRQELRVLPPGQRARAVEELIAAELPIASPRAIRHLSAPDREGCDP